MMDDDDVNEKLYPTVPDDDYTENDDGSVTIKVPDNAEPSGDTAHFDNLAEKVKETELSALAIELVDLIEYDKRARAKRDQQYAEGLKRSGVTEEAPGGAEFEGASRASHPVLLECSIDISASLYKEVFPADGPCKTKIFGEAGQEELDRAERIKTFMNYQLMEEIEEYESTLDETLSQVPLGGSQFMKFWWSFEKKRPTCEYVPLDDIYLPYSESSFYSARRKTHRFRIQQSEIDARIRSGMYREVDLSSVPTEPDRTKTEVASDRIEGKEPTAENEDGSREFWETYIELDLEFDKKTDGVAPYIITLDVMEHKILAIRRNWEEDDEERKPMDWLVEFPFIRWRGAYSLGFTQIIGGLTAASTGVLRAILDSAHINNSQSILKIKGARFGGQNKMANQTGVTELETAPNVDDIRKLVMPYPFKPPSPMLYELLGWLTNAAKGVVTTAEEKIADATSQMPVGTTLALIEQGGKVFSAIHKRTHKAQKKSLSILYRLNKMYLTKERIVEELGKLVVRPEDFQGPCNIVPVSDPNIFSETQRYAQMQAVHQLMLIPQFAQELDARKILDRTLDSLKIPDPDDIKIKRPEPTELNPVAENMSMALGTPCTAFPMQDHLAHMQAHTTFFKDPAFGSNPVILPAFVQQYVEHMKQHLVLFYAKMMYDGATAALGGKPISEFMQKTSTEEEKAELDKLLAVISVHVEKQSAAVLKDLIPIIQEAAQMADKMKMPQPMDPSAVAAQDVQRQAQKDQQDGQLKSKEIDQRGQLEAAKLQQKAQSDQQKQQDNVAQLRAKAQSEAQKQQAENQRKQAELAAQSEEQQLNLAFEEEAQQRDLAMEARKVQSDMAMNHEDNQTAIEIAAARAIDKQEGIGGVTSGKGVTNPNP